MIVLMAQGSGLTDGEANGIKLHKYVPVWVWIICGYNEMKTQCLGEKQIVWIPVCIPF